MVGSEMTERGHLRGAIRLHQKGDLTAWRGKLHPEDSRNAFVTQDNFVVTGNERNAWGGYPKPGVRNGVPVASFHSEQAAIDYVNKNG